MAQTTIDPSPASPTSTGMKFARLKQTHPRYNGGRIRMLHALYRGGVNLLGDDAVMDVVFGKIGDESDIVYGERKRRAFYENLFAMTINQISAGLAQDPCRLAQDLTGKSPAPALPAPKKELFPDDGNDEADQEIDPDAEDEEDPGLEDDGEDEDYYDDDDAPPIPTVSAAPIIDEYWAELMENATVRSEDGGHERTFDQVMRDICVEALVCGWSWFQVDLPKPSVDPVSLADQEDAGDLRAYIATWPTDAITDWEEVDGRILWVRTYECIALSEDPTTPRWPATDARRTHRWTVWTPTTWQRYDIVEDRDNPLTKWSDEMVVPEGESGDHSFGRVPWTRFDVCTPGTYLHVGDLIESLCRIYFNRTNGESWQWTQNCFQQLYEFLAPEIAGIDTEISAAQQDPSRARRQRRAPGVVHERGSEDRAEYVAPQMGGADVGAQATQALRDAVLRITAQMALAQDTSGAMLRRSADSKKQDTVAQEIIMGAVGKRLLTCATQAVKLCAIARGDDQDDAPKLEGYARFGVDDATTLISDTVALNAVDIPSATYQVEQKFRVASAHLGDNVSPEVLARIREELEGAITQDQIEKPAIPPSPFGDPGADPDDPDAGDGGGGGGGGFGGAKKGPPWAKKQPWGSSNDGPKKEPEPGHQEKPWSCGPASLVNICAALGILVDEATVRKYSGATGDGTDEEQLLRAAEKLDLVPRIIHTGDGDQSWNQLVASVRLGHPCLICVDAWDHWCAIIGIVGDRVVMQDPANEKSNVEVNGIHLLTQDQLAKRWKCRGVEKSFYAIAFKAVN